MADWRQLILKLQKRVTHPVKGRVWFSLAIVVALVLGLAGIFRWVIDRKPETPVVTIPVVTLPSTINLCPVRRALDGVCIQDAQDEKPVFAVMMDNSTDARPQFGIADAPLVFEAIAEGSITRFTVVYDLSQSIDKIGPVRSARAYYVSWAEQFQGIYAHVGGSPEALEKLKSAHVTNIDQFYYGSYFWRDQQRYAPHNVMTSTKLMQSLVENKSLALTPPADSWVYKPEKTVAERPTTPQTISMDFGSQSYEVSWAYNREKNEYVRSQGGKLHKDAFGTVVRAKNVVVTYTKSSIIDDYGRRSTTTIGSGKAIVFRDGEAVPGTWQRSKVTALMKFLTETGEPIEFNPGTTWVEVLPDHFAPATY